MNIIVSESSSIVYYTAHLSVADKTDLIFSNRIRVSTYTELRKFGNGCSYYHSGQKSTYFTDNKTKKKLNIFKLEIAKKKNSILVCTML